jgi:ribosomal protein S18 acetylase RimI-like enzyme
VSPVRPRVDLRPAAPADDPFLARLYASTRQQELAVLPWTEEQKSAFLLQQYTAQSAHYAKHYADASFQVVLVDGEPAGRLIVARWEGEIRIVDISLMPEHRGRGIGTSLLRPLLEEGTTTGAAVSIHVERFNPALRLYERLGFVQAADEGVYLRMERPPRGDQVKTAS